MPTNLLCIIEAQSSKIISPTPKRNQIRLVGFNTKPKLHPPQKRVGAWDWERRMLKSRRVAALEEVGCTSGSDGDMVWVMKEQHCCLGVEGSEVAEVVKEEGRKEKEEER